MQMQGGRYRRLKEEYDALLKLQSRSNFIKITPIDQKPGDPPEKYVVTYSCRGIAGIDKDNNPITSDLHQVEITLSYGYPQQEPDMEWLTPIWHPNIGHEEPRHVCTDNIKNYWGGKTLELLVRILGEMVQYKKYHAEAVRPHPIDHLAAEWVLNHAEPKGIVSKDTPFDKRPLLRPILPPPGKQIKKPKLVNFGRVVKRTPEIEDDPAPPPPPEAPKMPLVSLGRVKTVTVTVTEEEN